MNNGIALNGFIQALLPIQIAHYQRQGGVTEADIDRARSFADQLACHGDTLLYGGKPGEAGNLAGQLVDVLAIVCVARDSNLEAIERWIAEFGEAVKPTGGGQE